MRTALHAALLAAGPHALFGMITVARRVTLWDVRACPPSVKHVPLTSGGPSGRVSVPLADVMPLQARLLYPVLHRSMCVLTRFVAQAFLADISTCRDAIESAIDTLRPATQTERARVVRECAVTREHSLFLFVCVSHVLLTSRLRMRTNPRMGTHVLSDLL
jgi:hypothetical protein